MDYFSLKCFVEVVRTGSFSNAARKLFRTQPAISLQIRKLEKELKQPLLDRYKKQVVLTERGKLVYEHASELLDKLDDLKHLASHVSIEPQGNLTIATNLSLINNLLPPVIGDFHKKYPRVKVALLNLKVKDIGRAVLEGSADVGLGYLLEEHAEISQEKIKKADFVLVTRRDPLRKKPGASPKEILEGPLVHFEEGVDLRVYIERCLKIKPSLPIAIELPSIESILNYVQHGFGYSVLPDFSIAEHWEKKLLIKKLSNIIPPITISAYTHRRRILSKAAEKFLEILRKI